MPVLEPRDSGLDNELRAQVEAMIDEGIALTEVERWINRQRLTHEQHSELCTWAWAWRESNPRLAVDAPASLKAAVSVYG